MTTRRSRLSVVHTVVAAYVVAYYGWLAARWAGMPVPAVVGELAFFPLGLVIAWVNWRNSRVAWLDRRTRLAWRLLALAALVLWASGTAWTVLLRAGFSGAAVANVDRVAFVQYVLAIAGYLSFPARPRPRRGSVRFGLDVALIAVAAFAMAMYMGLRVLFHHEAQPNTLVVVELWVDWALFVVAAVGCMRKRDLVIRRALILLLASNLVSLAGNYLLAVMPSGAYHSGHPIDGLWFAAWALRWSAARLAWRHYASGPHEAPPPDGDRDYRSNPFAYVLVGGAFGLLVVQVLRGDQSFLFMLTVATAGLGSLLVARQLAEIEENRRLFEAQIEGEARFRSLVQNSSDVVIVVEEDGGIGYVSPSATAVFGGASYLRAGMPFCQLLAPEAAGFADALLGRTSGASPRFEAAMQVAPGSWREVEAVWSDLRDDPAVRGVVVTCRDVTDRNEVERHLRQAQKLDAVGHLAGGLAHDLNNVLGIIRGYAELLRSDLPGASAAGQDLDQILKAVDRAAGVTRRVLAFSRKQPGEVKLLDVNAAVGSLEPILRHLVKDHVEVRLELGAGVWPVLADQGQIEQVVVNLATNARDAMPHGGTVRIGTANRTLSGLPDDPTAPAGDFVELSVSDRGCGMSPQVAARIFEPFFSTKPQEALGLGLSIVHGIVTNAGGLVQVHTEEGRGSTFTVLLPRAS